MAPTAAVAFNNRASSAPPSRRMQNVNHSVSSAMSDRTATTYTSVAPSTPPTSMSRRSSTACDSPDLQALNKYPSPNSYTMRPTLFGFELTIACGVTKIPQWLHRLSEIDQCSVLARASTNKATDQPSLAEKGIVPVIGAVFARWLVRSVSENIFTLVIFGGLLWLVFGGYQGLEQQEQPVQPLSSAKYESMSETEDRFEVARVETITSSVEVMSLVEQNSGVVCEVSKVPQWLASCQDVFTTDGHTISTLESGEDSLYAADIGINITKATRTTAEDALSESFSDSSAAVLEGADSVQVSMGTNHTAKSHRQFFDDKDVGEEIPLNNDQLAALQYRHDYLEFNDTDQYGPGGRVHGQYIANHCDPVFFFGDRQVYEHVDEWPGRPLEADAKDPAFLLEALHPHLPEFLKDAINAQSMENMIKARAQNGENFFVQELEKQWHIICPGTVIAPGAPTATLQDMKNIITTNRKKFTPACAYDERRYVGLDHPCRPYLLEAEEMMINEGISDYNHRNKDVEFEHSVIHKVTKDSLEHAQIESYDRIPGWVYKIEQDGLLDPNAFHGCECGQIAITTLGSYRDEKEHNYKEMKGSASLFPIEVLDGNELHDAMADLVWDPHLLEYATPPRSQEVLRICGLHNTVTNNIFALVDTSVDDINGQISNPRGSLLAPGIGSPSYPPHFQTVVGSTEIPYEQRPPRCEHGHLHSSRCFPRGHVADRCRECIEHGLAPSTRHHNLKQLDAAHCAAVEATQEGQRNVYLAQNVQARRAKDLLAGFAHGTHLQPGIPSPAPAARPPAGWRRALQPQSEFAINPQFAAAVQRSARI